MGRSDAVPASPAGTPSSSTSTSSTRGTCARRSSSPVRGRSRTPGSMAACTSSPPRATGEYHPPWHPWVLLGGGSRVTGRPSQAEAPRPGVHEEAQQDRQRGAGDRQGRHAHPGGAGRVQATGEGTPGGLLAPTPSPPNSAQHRLTPRAPQIQQDLKAHAISVYPQEDFDEDPDDRLLNNVIRVRICWRFGGRGERGGTLG